MIMTKTLVDEIAQAIWTADGWDLDADPESHTAHEMRPVFIEQAEAVVKLLQSREDLTLPNELLTDDEHAAMQMTADLFNHIGVRVIGHGKGRTGDLNELVNYIHNIQRMIMGQAAARAYPNQYRLLGEEI